MTEAEQAAAFLAAHAWAPADHAAYLAALNKGEPFCLECADWHAPGDPHSAA